jgi:hypothetical protein
MEDDIFSFYNIQDAYSDYTQKTLASIVDLKYHSLTEKDFMKLADMSGATYLVEKRALQLPIVYRNDTYYIYRI